MKLAYLEVTPQLFIEFSKARKDGPSRRFVVKKNPLPDDAEIVRIERSDRDPYRLRLVVRSESFEDIPDDSPVPELEPVWFETVYDQCAGSVV